MAKQRKRRRSDRRVMNLRVDCVDTIKHSYGSSRFVVPVRQVHPKTFQQTIVNLSMDTSDVMHLAFELGQQLRKEKAKLDQQFKALADAGDPTKPEG